MGINESSTRDRASAEYWDRWWVGGRLPAAIDPYRPGLKNYPSRKFHQYFERVFHAYDTHGMELVEVGCAQSVYLPYFAKQFGFRVCGIDRSPAGCEAARAILAREGVSGEVYCADFFSPAEQLMGRFDVVVSFGVVEHFEPASGALRAMANLLKPQGSMITSIPNLWGILGQYQRLLDAHVYSVHVPLDGARLAAAHAEAGLDVASCEYFLPISLEVMNAESWLKRLPYWFLVRSHTALSRAAWWVDDHLLRLPRNRWTSPYINCLARKAGRTR